MTKRFVDRYRSCKMCSEKHETVEFYESEHWNLQLSNVMNKLMKVFDIGAVKHGIGSYLNDDNPSLQHKANCASLSRHLAEHTVDPSVLDLDSGLPHGYHLLCRILMTLARNEK